jgi:hypothetical protein
VLPALLKTKKISNLARKNPAKHGGIRAAGAPKLMGEQTALGGLKCHVRQLAWLSAKEKLLERFASTGAYIPVLAKRSQNFRLADGLAADYSRQVDQHLVTARPANLTCNARRFLLATSARARYHSATCRLHAQVTSQNETYGPRRPEMPVQLRLRMA